MSNLLIFFALPLATIIIAVVLERIWKNYVLVTLFAFAIYLVVAFALGDANLLVLVIIYTLLAFISAFLSMLFRKLNRRLRRLENAEESDEEERNLRRGEAGEEGEEGTNGNNNTANGNGCNCNRNNTRNFAINAQVTPNISNNGRTGTFTGQYRRRF